MKQFILLFILFVSVFASKAQTTTVNVGVSGIGFDSTYVIQTGLTDSFHAGNHPGAGPYQNGEILLCSHATLKYNYVMGTSSGPTFYLEPYAKLIFYGDLADARIYMKDSAIVDLMGYNVYIAQVKRISTANVLNTSASSNYIDSVFTAVNYTFNLWPGAISPCNNPTELNDLEKSEVLSFYPNPASSFLYLNRSLEGEFELSIFDMTGKKVLHHTLHSHSEIDISGFKQGVYFYQLSSKSSNRHGRFVKE